MPNLTTPFIGETLKCRHKTFVGYKFFTIDSLWKELSPRSSKSCCDQEVKSHKLQMIQLAIYISYHKKLLKEKWLWMNGSYCYNKTLPQASAHPNFFLNLSHTLYEYTQFLIVWSSWPSVWRWITVLNFTLVPNPFWYDL